MSAGARQVLASVAGLAAAGVARLVTGVRGDWRGAPPAAGPRVYFANHVSHGDFVLIWTVLPGLLRRSTRPVAAADYWAASPLRRFFGEDVFQAVLIDRIPSAHGPNPVDRMAAALDEGSALIVFPEGTRNLGDERLLPFKPGLFHLARARPDVDLVPVWIENLNRVMPKGTLVPVPLLCTVTFGAPMRLAEGESREAFLARARDALVALCEREDRR